MLADLAACDLDDGESALVQVGGPALAFGSLLTHVGHARSRAGDHNIRLTMFPIAPLVSASGKTSPQVRSGTWPTFPQR